MFGTTSRTIRFYEEKGLIQSTPGASRRRYTKEQIDNIKNVLVLRSLGVSVKSILELLNKDANLIDTLALKRAQIEALIETKRKEWMLLSNALVMIGSDKNIFDSELDPSSAVDNPKIAEIVKKCNKSVIGGSPEALYEHLDDTMKSRMPISGFEKVRKETLMPLGSFISFDKLEFDKKLPHIAYQYVKYEKLGLKIKYVFFGEKIVGFWLDYYEI